MSIILNFLFIHVLQAVQQIKHNRWTNNLIYYPVNNSYVEGEKLVLQVTT